MTEQRTRIVADVATYYSGKLAQHGATPRGVDWKDEASQNVRFDVLLTLIKDPSASLLDVGCGFGSLLPYARERGFSGAYLGTDIAPAMMRKARQLHQADAAARFELGIAPDQPCDYAVASGIFNVRLTHDTAAWQAYMEDIVALMNRSARCGFAFNCLTSYADSDRMRPDLHYADQLPWFDLCKRNYAPAVALLHDYGLWEWTLIVRKDG
jgi:SAM-dependent methyltransferase